MILLALAAAATAPNYADPSAWLCRPGRQDACAADQSTTVIDAKGKRTIEPIGAAAVPPKVDCFYVYPTVSTDPEDNSDLNAGAEERSVAAVQAARFQSVCRLFAPLYRQATLTSLRNAMLSGKPRPQAAIDLAFQDVKAAWSDYLKRDNGGRGVVLIGHSQGAGMLKRLIAEEIEDRPEAKKLVSALLIGHNVLVPKGKLVGGDLKSTPLCQSAGQTGCVVSYVSFLADSPPPERTLFGRAADPAMQVACTNPANLAGGAAATKPYFVARGMGERATPFGPWSKDGAPVTTTFVSTPGLITARCVADEKGSYLAISATPAEGDVRSSQIGGEVSYGGMVLKDWGLHLIDTNLAMGDLVALVGRQAQAWR
ncbi:DUF3089 domain-containing protein [Sphingomonas sp.]|jgi:hypothetical protein|uniref:DUF3089 domain-containing protein n=1 Tax=Sphingomonas sp. TaxID=28214 RepID=UPI002DF2567D|nr:DUF3089 domain-containing protein [Sphingomonas sp.]